MGARGFQQDERAHHVGLHERARAIDRAVDMGFGRQVHHGVRLMRREDLGHGRGIRDVGADLRVAGVMQRLLQRILAGGVRHPVDIDDAMVAVPYDVTDDARSNEAASAGHKNSHRASH